MGYEDSPLRRGLSPLERHLLSLLTSHLYGQLKGWPVWDYVSREFYSKTQGSAEDVLAGLPSILLESGPYGLVWRSERNLSTPAPGEKVGLTVAGLNSSTVRLAPELAQWMVSAGRACGEYEATLVSDPFAPVNSNVDASSWGDKLEGLAGVADGLPIDIAWEAFSHEPLMPRAFQTGPSWSLIVNSSHRELRHLTDVDSYLDMVENASLSREAVRFDVPGPFSLAASLDYFALVVQTQMEWPRIVRIRHALPVAQLAHDAVNREEFADRLNGLYEVLNSLDVPAVDADVLSAGGWQAKGQPGTVAKLGFHLASSADPSTIWMAIDDLQSIIRIRSNFNHPSADRDTLAAHRTLGLAYPIRDWMQGWNTIRVRATRAFDSMREALQAEPPDTGD